MAFPWRSATRPPSDDDCADATAPGSDSASPLPPEFIPAHGLVFDLVYNPPETPLLARAKAAGARAVSGLDMLIYQGAESIRLWTGREPPIDVMRAVAAKALAEG